MKADPLNTFSITRAAHAEYGVTCIEQARAFYVAALGMHEVDCVDDALYLGCLEETDKYSLVLRKAAAPGLSHLSFRVSLPEDLERLEHTFRAQSLATRWIEANTLEAGQGRALRVQDVSGLPLEFFCELEQRERLLQQYSQYRGAHIMRIDHFNCQVPDVQKAFEWWNTTLGFQLSEFTVTEDSPEALWAVWLRRKQSVHDIALMNGKGPRMHHVGLWCQDTPSILRACDILASLGKTACIERGPGRHGLSNAFFLYLRDYDNNRIELYTNDYIIPDPDFKPIRWKLNDPRRATFWGHHPPESWYEEAIAVQNIHTGELLPLSPAKQSGKPDFVT